MERTKKVEPLINDAKDIERRKQLENNELNNVWIKGTKLKTSTKINNTNLS